MVQAVKGPRSYDSPRRRAQAAATRAAILEAAERLFIRDGYVATSVPAIAQEADVALKTVYVGFDTKPNLLRRLWEERLAPDEASMPVMDRSWYRQVIAEGDPRRQLELLAAQGRRVKTRSGDLMEVIRNAAPVDEDIARLWDDVQTKLLSVARSIVEQLLVKNKLTEGLDVATGSDILWTLNHPSLWHLLVRERGWTPERYEAWLVQTSCSQLLRNDVPSSSK
jgi:AcrR family transcriptional regulator